MERIRKYLPPFRLSPAIPIGIAFLVGLYAVSRSNALLFHCLTELFAVIVALAVFALFWNTRRYLDNGLLLMIGFGCFFSGLLDLLHVFAYPGMGVFSHLDLNVSLQAKVASQWFASCSCPLALAFLHRKINHHLGLLAYSALLALIVASIVVWQVFPVCYVEGLGPTAFYRVSRGASCAIFVVSALLLIPRRKEFDVRVFWLLLGGLAAVSTEEFFAGMSRDIQGTAEVISHLAETVALVIIYKVFIEVGLTKPLDLLFHNQQQTAETLERQQHFLEAVLDKVQSGIVACDANGVLTLFNRAACEFHAAPLNQLPAGRWAEHYDLYYTDGATRMATEDVPLYRALRGENLHDVEIVIAPKQGAPRMCVVSGGPLRDKQGRNSGAVVAMSDVTERKEAELTLKKREEELRQSQKLEAVGLLAGGIAHEFNNLLQAIGGYTSCVMERLAPDDECYRDLELVLQAAERAGTLTRQLLGFSRRRVLQPQNVAPNQVVADLAKMVRPLIGEAIRLEMTLAPDVGTVFADAGELSQVLLNLCLNARDAMPRGGRLLLKTENVVLDEPLREFGFETAPGPYIVFSVTDTGCGISPAARQHLFEPFHSTKGIGKGTGLGLAMVYGIVQQHQGAIHVYSEPDAGTAIKIYLPAARRAAAAEVVPPAQDLPCGSETILLAEDEPMVRDLAIRILEKGGYQVRAAADGEMAVQLYEKHGAEIALVILDAIMPALTGHEAYRRIQALNPAVRVVFCTGYDPETVHSSSLVAERLRLIQKPFDAGTLLRSVREALDEDSSCRPCAEVLV